MTVQDTAPESMEEATRSAWPGVWPGTVVSDQDPDKRGRLRIRVPQIYGAEFDPVELKIPDDRLPWARPCFPWTGEGAHELQVPPVGAGVWVTFWGADAESPVWLGGFLGAEDADARFTSSYKPGPTTRLIVTPQGHRFEMRGTEGEEEILVQTNGGRKLRMVDIAAQEQIELVAVDGSYVRITEADALGGPKIEGATPAQRKFLVDDKLQKATLETATQKVELLDIPVPTVRITAAGNVEVVAPNGHVIQTYGGGAANAVTMTQPATYTFGAALALLVAGVLSITVATIAFAGALAITIPGVLALTATGAVAITGSAVALGAAGAKQRLCNEALITAVINANKAIFDAHLHTDSMAGGTSPPQNPLGIPTAFVAGVPGTHTTNAVTAN